mmetsp:Transcript_9010/g.23323  ORF Transcript_9010/g.23323 Transcript_9010/m.23323 type:complete len:234 (-) Transcript_9010:377-1078(-)
MLQRVRRVRLAPRPLSVGVVIRVVGVAPSGILLLEAGEAGPRASSTQPWMAKRLISSEPVTSAHLQQSEDEVQGSLRYIFPRLLREAQITLHNLPIQLVQHIMEERQGSAQQHVGDHTDRPDVDFPAVLLLFDDLRCQVEVGAADRVRAGKPSRIVPRDLREAEVRDLHVGVADLAGQQDVLRLQVAVHDALAVDVSARLQEIVASQLGLLLRVVLLLLNAVIELATLAQLQH